MDSTLFPETKWCNRAAFWHKKTSLNLKLAIPYINHPELKGRHRVEKKAC